MRLFLFVLGLILIAATITIGIDTGAEFVGAHKKSAIRHAQAYANTSDTPPLKSLNCINKDNDGDGLIPCTFFLKDGSSYKVECDGFHLFGGNDYCEPHNEIAITQE